MAKKKPPRGSTMAASKRNAQNGKGALKGGTPNQRSKGDTAVSGQKANPFERMWNRRKFDVLGKKTKGEQRKVGQSRSRAVEMRKDTLLHEYRQSKKANAFIDRRFGESDASLAEDDKAIMRYQKERLAQLNKRSRFNLKDDDVSDGEEDLLMHRGVAAGVDDFDEGDVPGEEDENNPELDAEIVDKLHFGGFERASGGESLDIGKPKTRKEVMEELIAKSKFYKAQKAKEKEEADDLLGTLDEQFRELTQKGLLASKPSKKDDMSALMAKYGVAATASEEKGRKADTALTGGKQDLAGKKKEPKAEESAGGMEAKRAGAKDSGKLVPGKEGKKSGTAETEPEKDDYEKLAREMASDLRARASDRTKDPEEAAKEERERLEKLEKKRRQRMEGLDEETEGEESEDETGGRRARKRRKRAETSGDDLGENFVLEGEEFQQEGWATDIMKQGEDEDEDDEESGEEDELEGSADEDDDVSEDEDDDVTADGDDEGSQDDADVSGGEGPEDDVSGGEEESGSGSDGDLDDFLGAVQREKEMRELEKREKGGQEVLKRKKNGNRDAASDAASLEKPDPHTKTGKGGRTAGKVKEGARKKDGGKRPRGELPYVIDAPQTLELFRAIVDGRSDAELALAIERIRACNSVKLAADNRRKMQIFYSVLVQYFSALAGDSPLPLGRIDVLVKPLLEMSQDTPLIAAVNARERILKMQQQLSAKLRDPDGSSCWPSARTLLLLRLWTLTFPPSDFRHPVTTPLAILVGEYLARCHVAGPRDAAVGAFLSAFALQFHSQAKRFCPEAVTFLHALLLTALPPSSQKTHPSLWGAVPAYLREQVGSQLWLHVPSKTSSKKDSEKHPSETAKKAKAKASNGVSENGVGKTHGDHTETASPSSESESLDLVSLLSGGADLREYETDQWKQSLLAAVLETLGGFVRLYKGLPSFSELFRPLGGTLEALLKEGLRSETLQAAAARLREDITTTSADVISTRQPVRMRTKRAEPIKQYNPRFEEDGYVAGRDYDPDRERAEKKKLKKQLKKETKGAARELRKDNYFLAEEKRRDQLVAEEERHDKYRSAMAFLQQQEGAFKSGQLGGGKRKRK